MIKIPGRIPVTVQPLFWLFALLIGWLSTMTFTGMILWLVVIFVSILIHEYGHALTALFFGQKARIELAAFGGFTYREGSRLKLWQEFIVVLNGPLAGFCLFLISWLAVNYLDISKGAVFYQMLQISLYVNLIWTLMNLAPILPLDGGHLLSIFLEAIFGFKGIKIALVIGLIFSISLSAYFFIINAFLIGAIFLILAFEGIRSFRFYRLLSSQDRNSDLQTLFKEGQEILEKGNSKEAISKFNKVRQTTKEGILHLMATEQIAMIYKAEKRYEEAYQLLKPLQDSISAETLPLYHFLAYANQDYLTVTKVGDQCYQIRPTSETALINASAYGAQSKPEPTIGWLECAIRLGATSIKEIVKKPEFDSVRNDPNFQKFTHSL